MSKCQEGPAFPLLTISPNIQQSPRSSATYKDTQTNPPIFQQKKSMSYIKAQNLYRVIRLSVTEASQGSNLEINTLIR